MAVYLTGMSTWMRKLTHKGITNSHTHRGKQEIANTKKKKLNSYFKRNFLASNREGLSFLLILHIPPHTPKGRNDKNSIFSLDEDIM